MYYHNQNADNALPVKTVSFNKIFTTRSNISLGELELIRLVCRFLLKTSIDDDLTSEGKKESIKIVDSKRFPNYSFDFDEKKLSSFLLKNQRGAMYRCPPPGTTSWLYVRSSGDQAATNGFFDFFVYSIMGRDRADSKSDLSSPVVFKARHLF
ncbi:unnamed protein product [Amoebophrya sp. A120]|nr:unnamed protein product [Amoebophrya sp. A120]|eukprot:GSA120T00010437001.1